MTVRTDTERVLDLFLAPEPEQLADRVIDAALAEIATTPQRTALRVTWGIPGLRAGWRTAAFAALGLAAVLGAAGLGARIAQNPGFGDPATPTPSVAATAAPPASPAPTGPRRLRTAGTKVLEPGTYVLDLFPVDLAFDIPAGAPPGWLVDASNSGYASVALRISEAHTYTFNLYTVSGVYTEPCVEGSAVKPLAGPSVDNLVATVSNQDFLQASEPVDVTVGDFAGKEFVLTGLEGCDETWAWVGVRKISLMPGEERVLQVLDVGGVPIVLETWVPLEPMPAAGAELQRILDSFRIESLAPER